jgi:hypothetical protein
MRIQWSVKVEWRLGGSTLGMWQVTQFFVATGQAAPGWVSDFFSVGLEAWHARQF